jgi:hypothetical protein
VFGYPTALRTATRPRIVHPARGRVTVRRPKPNGKETASGAVHRGLNPCTYADGGEYGLFNRSAYLRIRSLNIRSSRNMSRIVCSAGVEISLILNESP